MNPERVIKAHMDRCKAELEAKESWRPVSRESAEKRMRKADEEIIEARLAEWQAQGLVK